MNTLETGFVLVGEGAGKGSPRSGRPEARPDRGESLAETPEEGTRPGPARPDRRDVFPSEVARKFAEDAAFAALVAAAVGAPALPLPRLDPDGPSRAPEGRDRGGRDGGEPPSTSGAPRHGARGESPLRPWAEELPRPWNPKEVAFDASPGGGQPAGEPTTGFRIVGPTGLLTGPSEIPPVQPATGPTVPLVASAEVPPAGSTLTAPPTSPSTAAATAGAAPSAAARGPDLGDATVEMGPQGWATVRLDEGEEGALTARLRVKQSTVHLELSAGPDLGPHAIREVEALRDRLADAGLDLASFRFRGQDGAPGDDTRGEDPGPADGDAAPGGPTADVPPDDAANDPPPARRGSGLLYRVA